MNIPIFSQSTQEQLIDLDFPSDARDQARFYGTKIEPTTSSLQQESSERVIHSEKAPGSIERKVISLSDDTDPISKVKRPLSPPSFQTEEQSAPKRRKASHEASFSDSFFHSYTSRLDSADWRDILSELEKSTPSLATDLPIDFSLLETQEAANASPSQTEPFSAVSQIEEIRTSLLEHLKARGISVDGKRAIGVGGQGFVYAAISTADPSKEYVLKIEKRASLLSCFLESSAERALEYNPKWWRHGDIAASRIKDLPRFAKSICFIIGVTSPSREKVVYYSVPTSQVKEFAQSLENEPAVYLKAQLIERAPGKDLLTLLRNPAFKPTKHFYPIAQSLFSFLEKSFERNFIHRDLKPENFIYDPSTRKGTVIDAGLGGAYGKRSKMQPGIIVTKSGNPLYSTRRVGTVCYLPQVVFDGTPYGAEIDFHGAAVMLAELLEPKYLFELIDKIVESQKIKNTEAPRRSIPTSCDDYLRYFQYFRTSNTFAKHLKNDPTMKTTIDLFFAVAAAKAEDTHAAFEALKRHMETIVGPKLQEQKI